MRFALFVFALVAALASMASAEVISTTPTTVRGSLQSGFVITPGTKNVSDPTKTWPVPTFNRTYAEVNQASKEALAYFNKTNSWPIVYGYGRLGNATQVRLNETRAERARATLTTVAKLSAAENATAAALNFTSPLAGAESVLDQAIINALKATNSVYNLTIGKYVNATVYKIAVLPPRATVGKVNVTRAVTNAIAGSG